MIDQPELLVALREFARSSAPLVVCDYDGTLAQLVDDPDQAFPVEESVVALETLATFADTHVAVVSGRSLHDLVALCPFPPEIHLVGSHGSEFDGSLDNDLDPAQLELLSSITEELDQLAASGDGLLVESKPTSVAFHYRKAAPEIADAALEAVRSGPAARDGVRVKAGKMVIELAVVDTDKGTAIDRLRHSVGADVVLFVGDDVTDEDAFAVLHGHDIGIKVGPGPTIARYRIGGTDDTARTLMLLCGLRRTWLEDGPDPTSGESLPGGQPRGCHAARPPARAGSRVDTLPHIRIACRVTVSDIGTSHLAGGGFRRRSAVRPDSGRSNDRHSRATHRYGTHGRSRAGNPGRES
jgi:trehalose 6-phosphate phosphatase